LESSGTSLSFDVSLTKIYAQDQIAKDPTTHGSTFVPVILGSDKTTVSVATGQNDYYPLYASIGNVRNNVRRAHHGALAVVGFLAMPQSMFLFNCVYSLTL
jgi:hypothetical protein